MLRVNTEDDSFLIRKANILCIEANMNESYNNIFKLNMKISTSKREIRLEFCSNDKDILNETKNKILDNAASNSNTNIVGLEKRIQELENMQE